jgi:hypothetical protein
VVRKAVFDRVGSFNESLVQLSDLDLWVRIAAISELFIYPEVLTKMRIVKGKNFSAPSIVTQNRAILEFLQVLSRYAQKPILGQMGNILPGKVRGRLPLELVQQGRLIQKCWQIGSPVHILFATQLAGTLLQSPKNRLVLATLFGTKFIHQYLDFKGKVKLVVE